VIQNEVEDLLSDGLLNGKFKPSSTVKIGLLEGKLVFEGEAPAAETPAVGEVDALIA
jgi:ATP-dependent Clp protease ATP-binding subunit ClpA